MKHVFTAKHPTEAHLIRGMLEAEGIRAEVRGDQLYGAFGELPVPKSCATKSITSSLWRLMLWVMPVELKMSACALRSTLCAINVR